MTAALSGIIDACLDNRLTLSDAQKQAAQLGDTPEAVIPALWEIGKSVDQLRGTRPNYELVASLVCWHAAHQVSDDELRALLAFNLGRSLLMHRELDQAQVYLDEAERCLQKTGDRSKLTSVLGTRATLLMLQGDYDSALALSEEVNARSREVGDSLGEAASALAIGQILIDLGQSDAARDWLLRALELYRSLGQRSDELKCLGALARTVTAPADDPQMVHLLSQAVALAPSMPVEPVELIRLLGAIGNAQIRLSALADAEGSFSFGLHLCRELGRSDLEGIFAGNLGALYVTTGRPREARPMLELALSIAEAYGDADGMRIARYNLAKLEELRSAPNAPDRSTGRDSDASSRGTSRLDDQAQQWLDYLTALATRLRNEPQRAELIFDEIESATLAADAASDIADVILDRADELDEQDPYLAYALMLVLEHWLPADARADILIPVYQRIGFFASRSSDIEQAVQAFSTASEIAREAGRTEQFLASMTNLANTLRQAGHALDAVQVYERALEAITPTTPPDLEASVLLNASTAYSDLGQYERAKELNGRAASLLSNLPGQELSLAIALTNLAGDYYALGEIAAAEPKILKALELTREGNIPSQEGVALGHLGLIRFRQGRVSDAIRYLTTALQIAQDTRDLWNAQHWERDLANIYTWTKLPEQALYHFQRALDLSRRIGDHRSEGICLLGLAINTLTQDLEAGLEYLRQAWQIQRSTGNILAALDVALTFAGAYTAEAVDLPSIKPAILEGKPWQTVAAGRLKNPEALRLARQWLEQAQDLSSLVAMPKGNARLALREADILRLEGRIEEAVARLEAAMTADPEPIVVSNCHAALADLYSKDLQRPDLAAQHLEQAIAGYEALSEHLDWSEHRITFRDNFAVLYSKMVECALALDRPDMAFAYCERSKLAEMQRLWSLRQGARPAVPKLSELSRLVNERGTTAIIEFMLAVDRVYVFVVAPGLTESEQILVLHDIALPEYGVQWWLRAQQAYEDLKSPMSAFDPEARKRWQAEVEAICVQIGTQLLQPVFAKIAALPLREIVFVPHSLLHCFPLHAAPLFDEERWIDRYRISYAPSASVLLQQWTTPAAKPATLVGFADSLDDLPMARIEVLQAVKLFPGRAQLYRGQDVSRERVIASLRQADWVHFACHAVQVLDDSYATGLYLSSAGGREGDNFLSLFAINRDVQLPDNTTIILSACESGMVTPHLSDEFFSLAGGFMAAGAGTVIATYWKVHDVCAMLILDRLYAGLRDGSTISIALRGAELWVRDLNEAQVFDALQRLLATSAEFDGAATESILASFAARRLNHRPFHHVADWAAFFLAGRTDLSVSMEDTKQP